MDMNENEIRLTVDDVDEDYEVVGYEDDPYSGGWIVGTGERRSEVSGNLRQMVLDKVGNTDEDATVEVVETVRDGGYCQTCSFAISEFSIEVNREMVYEAQFQDNPFGVLQDWLTTPEGEEDE